MARGYKGFGVLLHLLVDYSGLPIAITSTPANGNEREEVIPLLQQFDVEGYASQLCNRPMVTLEADKGYDSNPLRQKLLNRGILPYILRRKTKKPNPNKPPHKETAKTFSIKSVRWQVERAHSSLKGKVRRLRVRWERSAQAWTAILMASLSYFWIELLFG